MNKFPLWHSVTWPNQRSWGLPTRRSSCLLLGELQILVLQILSIRDPVLSKIPFLQLAVEVALFWSLAMIDDRG